MPMPGTSAVATERLIEEFGPRIRALAARSARDQHAADDLCQDIWTKAHRALRQSNGESPAPGWLYRLASRVCIDAARRRGRAPASAPPEALDYVAGDAGPLG